MTEPIRVSGPVGADDKMMTLETGELAQLADGAVVVRIGDTTVLATAVTSAPREGIDFFPLTVDVEERMYAAGKIPGSFFRREGRPTEQAILTARLTDRPLRPSFPDGFRNEVQIIATILGADLENPHDVACINGASAALWISGIPFQGPIGAARVAHHEGRWIANPTYQEADESTFEMVIAGRRTESGDIALMMVEAFGNENTWRLYEQGAPKVTEETVAEGLEFAKGPIGASIDLQIQLRQRLETERGPIEPIAFEPRFDYEPDVFQAVSDFARDRLREVMAIPDKAARDDAVGTLGDELLGALVGTEENPGPFSERSREVGRAYRSLQKEVVRSRIAQEGVRIDGRTPEEIRPLSARVGVIPTAHGSALFQRGETQVLTITTLGMPRMGQMLDTIGIDDSKRYMHHYNFPPFSTGETGRVGSPKRREIGHGALAERALLPVVPPEDEFPYALRVVSEVLSSNGSTSMASVCGSSMSLMDAGVPLRSAVAGIAMGLVYAEGTYTTLTDILGAEDAFGDMDFKVAGTSEFVTALQLDTKIDGLPAEVLAQALRQAREARLKVLEVMNQAIAAPRDDVRDTAPKITSLQIPLEKVGEVIGPKGKVVNTLQQETGADINIEDDGTVGIVTVGAKEKSKVDEAIRRIQEILNPPEAEVGQIYLGKVVNITKFGAFVNVLPGRDGLLHISKLGGGRRVERVEDVLELGQELNVRVDEIDPKGKLSLSLVDEGAGEPVAGAAGPEPALGVEESAGSPRAPRGDDGGREVASFQAAWDEQARERFGDLGPSVPVEGPRPSRPGQGGGRRRRR